MRSRAERADFSQAEQGSDLAARSSRSRRARSPSGACPWRDSSRSAARSGGSRPSGAPGPPRRCRRRGGRTRSRRNCRRPRPSRSAWPGRGRPRRSCAQVKRPEMRSISASSSTRISTTASRNLPLAAISASSASAWARVRGKPSKIRPCLPASPSSCSAIRPMTMSSVTRSPRAITSATRLPISVPGGLGGAQHVAGRELHQPVLLDEDPRLRPLARSRRAQQDDVHRLGFPRPLPRRRDFSISPSYWCASMWDWICVIVSIVTDTTISREVPPK